VSFRSWQPWSRTSVTSRRSPKKPKPPLQLHLDHLEDRTLLSASIPINGTTWTSIGPTNINEGQPASGRITGLAADPTNANIIYAGTASGGVWKTTNGGTSWSALTDNQATLMIGAIAVAPTNPNVVYAGTGEANWGPSKAFISRANIYPGLGVLRSTDAGNTWVLEGTAFFNRRTISRVVVDPLNPNIVYVAVGAVAVNGLPGNTGIWKSTDGGVTWSDTTTTISPTAAYSDLAIDPQNGQVLYAAVGDPNGNDPANGIWKSTDGGSTWQRAGNSPQGSDSNVGRITIALAPSSPNTLYASVAQSGHYAHLYEMIKSTDGGAHWTQLTNVPDYLDPGITLADGTQIASGDYDTSLAVDPTDPNIIYAGGVASSFYDFMQSTDGGADWNSIVQGVNNVSLHGDEHAIAFTASGRLLDGNDGGIWRLDNANPGSIVWTDLNSNLSDIQFEGIALSPADPNVALGGSQDNGTEVFNDNLVWPLTDGGDGGKVIIDPSNPRIMYHDSSIVSFSSQYFVEKSLDGGQTWNPFTNGLTSITPQQTVYYPPMVMDPTNDNRLLLGASNLYETTDGGNNWIPISTPGSNGWNGTSAPISSIAIAPTAPNTIYATAGGHLFATTNDGGSWQGIDIPNFTDSFAYLTVSPSDSHTVFAVRDRYTGGPGGHVFESTDGGRDWTDVSGNLPDAPANTVAFDPRTSTIYVGTDFGVYASVDGGNSWAPFGGGLPNVRITQLVLDPTLNILAAGTYGRGMWEINVSSVAAGSGVMQFSASNYTVDEHAGTVTITVTRTGGSGTISVGYVSSDGTARAGVDYTAVAGTLTFGPTDTSKTFTVNVFPDISAINNLTFHLTLSQEPGGGSLGTPSAADVTIVESNFGAFQFTTGHFQAAKESGTATIKVERVGGAAGTVTVHYSTSDGTAQAGVDYQPASGTLTLIPGQTVGSFTIVLLDSASTSDETVNLTLDTPTGGATLGSLTTATLVILPINVVPPVSLVTDLGTGPGPADLTNVGGVLFFAAQGQLWRSDGTDAGTVIIKPIPSSVGPENLTNVNGTLFFTDDDLLHGRQLWRSDGTALGTYVVKDINPSGDSNPSDLTNVSGTLYFAANDGGLDGVQLWKSDGTANGTVLVADVNGPGVGSYPTELTNVSGTLYFAAQNQAVGGQLYRSNGTAAGTALVKLINVFGANPADLTNVGGKLFFSADDGTHGDELWASDGTASGTVMVADINAGVGGNGLPLSSSPQHLTNVGGVLFFTATEANDGAQVWRSDGTPGGTMMVADLNPGASSSPADLANVNGVLFFSAFTASQGRQLYRSDGTPAGTAPVTQLNLPAGLNPTNLINVNGLLYFSGDSTSLGTEIWRSDGSSAGTVMVADINLGAGSSNPTDLTQAGKVLFFAATDGGSPSELWEVNNQPPTITVPATQSSNGSSAVVFSSALGTAITISDVDAGDGTLQVSLSAVNGRLTLAQTTGLTFLTGTGSGDTAMTFTGLLASINAALNGLTFTPINSTGTTGLAVSVSDQGNTGFGGAQSVTASVGITLPASNGGGNGNGQFTGTPGVLSLAGSNPVLFALNTGHSLYAYRSGSGWSKLGDNIATISSATESSGNAVVFVVTQDHGLFRFSFTTGWQMIGAPGTIASVSAGTDSGGRGDAFVLTTAGDFVEFRGSSGWVPQIGGRGTILSASAIDGDRVLVVTADHSIFEFDPGIGWFPLTSPGFARTVSAVRDASGQLEVFAITLGQALYRHEDALGWNLIGNAGSIAAIAPATDTAGAAAVFVVTTQSDLAEFDTRSGWSILNASQPVGALAAGAVDRVFAELNDRTIVGHDDTFGFYPLTGPGFLGS
jgi:ELWxxDGT repeat protein